MTRITSADTARRWMFVGVGVSVAGWVLCFVAYIGTADRHDDPPAWIAWLGISAVLLLVGGTVLAVLADRRSRRLRSTDT